MKKSAFDVLLVEDQPTDAELVLRALTLVIARDRIVWVRDGEQALQAMADLADSPSSDWPRLVLLDVKMPRLGGLDAVLRLKLDPAYRHVPMIIFSSSADQLDVARAYECGANSYVFKPVDFDELESRVRQLAQYWLGLNVALA